MSESQNNAVSDTLVADPVAAKELFEKGWKLEQAGQRLEAIEVYELAYSADPDNDEVCFRLAYNLDLVGEENEAVLLYEQLAQTDSPSINVLINLAIIYEDRNQFGVAERLIRQVLATNPIHAKARLYLKDILDSKAMVIEEEIKPDTQKHQILLDTPVTDFDLTVQSRNTLRNLNVRILSDLLCMTESELRHKNANESCIEEIKAMLAQRKLKLGQTIEQRQNAARLAEEQAQSANDARKAILATPVNELELSVRARKALSLLNISTLGELSNHTEAELMGIKNFGITSLHEIREKLESHGLSLRKLED